MTQTQTILITGADGFAGRHLLPQLHQAFPAAHLIPTSLTPRPGHSTVDITNFRDLDTLIHDTRPTAVVHLAAISAIPAARDDPDHALLVNTEATLALAHGLLRHAPVCTLLFVSSADVYGAAFAEDRPLTEADAPRPMNAYAASKAAAEMWLQSLAHERGLRAIIARPTNHTGPGQSPGFVVPDFCAEIRRARATGAPIRTGRLDTLRDFLDVRDVCAAYVRILASAATLAPGTTLNLASGTPRHIGAILDDLLALAGLPGAAIEPAPARQRPTDILVARVDAARARALLGWAPTIPWSRTLADTLAG